LGEGDLTIQVVLQGLPDGFFVLTGRNTDVVAVAFMSYVEKDILELRNLGHPGTAKKLFGNGIPRKLSLSQVELESS